MNSIASSTFAEENIQPLVKVSLDGDIALDKDKPTAHPAHYWEPDQEPGGQNLEAVLDIGWWPLIEVANSLLVGVGSWS